MNLPKFDVCPDCPVAIALEVGLEEIKRSCEKTELHNPIERHDAAIGAIELGKSILSGVIRRSGCEGPVAGAAAYLVCPNTSAFEAARQMIEGPHPNSGFSYGRFINDSSSTNGTGQYL